MSNRGVHNKEIAMTNAEQYAILENIASDVAKIAAGYTSISETFTNAEIVNVKEYGARGNGITDDTDALNTALARNPYKCIMLPSGTYNISGSLKMNHGVTLIGLGKVVIKRVAKYPAIIFVPEQDKIGSTTYFGISDVSLQNITIDCNGTNLGRSYTCGAILNYCNNISFKNCTFKDSFSSHAIELGGSNNVEFIDCKFLNCYPQGAKTTVDNLHTACEVVQMEPTLSNDYSVSTLYGIDDVKYEVSSKNIKFIRCSFINDGSVPKMFTCIGNHYNRERNGYNPDGLLIKDCYFDGAYYNAIRLYSVNNAIVTNNIVKNCPCAVSLTRDARRSVGNENVIIANNLFECIADEEEPLSPICEQVRWENATNLHKNIAIVNNIFNGDDIHQYIDLHDVNTFTISNNIFSNTADYAMVLKNLSNGIISNNIACNLAHNPNVDALTQTNLTNVTLNNNTFMRK